MNYASTALDLSTDLRNIRSYEGNQALVAQLVLTAEEKLAAITAHLADVRQSIGMRGSAAIIDISTAREA